MPNVSSSRHFSNRVVPASTSQSQVSELQNRVRELEAKLEAANENKPPIAIDPKNDSVKIRGLETSHFRIDQADLTIESLGETIEDAMSLERITESMQGEKGSSIFDSSALTDSAVTVDNARMSIPAQTLVETAELRNGDALAQRDIKDLKVQPVEGNALKISGKVDKLIDIPFEVKATLGTEPGNLAVAKMSKSKLFKFLPIPGFLTQLALRVSGKSLEEMGAKVEGNKVSFDIDDSLPPNVRFQLNHLGTENGNLIIAGGAPKNPANTNRIPATAERRA